MILFSSWTVLSSVLDVTSVLLSCHAQNQGKFKLVRRTNSSSWRLRFYHANALAIFFQFFFPFGMEYLAIPVKTLLTALQLLKANFTID